MSTTLEALKTLGLTENESKIYYFLIQNGKSIFSGLIEGTGLQNKSVTRALNTLIEKALIVRLEAGKRIYYIIENPKNLKNNIQNEITIKQNALEDVMENIETTYDSVIDGKPRVIFYKGLDGLKEHWKRILKKKIKLVKQIVNNDLRLFQDTKRDERKTIFKQGANADVIFTAKEKPKNIPEGEMYAPYTELGELPIEIGIYENNVIFILSKKANRPAILIEDEDIAKGMETIYNMLKKSLTHD